MKKTTIIMMGVAIIVVLGTELGWWNVTSKK
ncbi:protein YoaJ [Pseudomonas aeruginosa]